MVLLSFLQIKSYENLKREKIKGDYAFMICKLLLTRKFIRYTVHKTQRKREDNLGKSGLEELNWYAVEEKHHLIFFLVTLLNDSVHRAT